MSQECLHILQNKPKQNEMADVHLCTVRKLSSKQMVTDMGSFLWAVLLSERGSDGTNITKTGKLFHVRVAAMHDNQC